MKLNPYEVYIVDLNPFDRMATLSDGRVVPLEKAEIENFLVGRVKFEARAAQRKEQALQRRKLLEDEVARQLLWLKGELDPKPPAPKSTRSWLDFFRFF